MRRRVLLWVGLIALFTSLGVCGELQAKTTYKVQPGDTLTAIAAKSGVTTGALKAANKLKGSNLKANQILTIPAAKTQKVSVRSQSAPRRPKEFYIVRKKDTLSSIAAKTGVSVADLQQINELSGTTVKAGQRLSLKRSEEEAERLAGYIEDLPGTEELDDNDQTPEEAWAEIERRKNENDALLGKWSSPDEPKLLVKAAMGFLGAPYRLGGFSIRGIDCSGLVKKIYQLFDIELPRTAYEQSHVGMRVARNDLTEGDLIFFNTRRRFGHVGIYIGNNEFVHAASRKRGVRVDSLDTPYFKKRFIRAVRLKGDGES